jgi:membrane protease YdiL (CAAX protease family)
MKTFISAEVSALVSAVKEYGREITILTLAVLFFTAHSYHPLEPAWLKSLVYYAVAPLTVILLVLRNNPLDFGLRAGNWRTWGVYVGIFLLISLPVLLACSRIPALENYYYIEQFRPGMYILQSAASLFGWEFILRGFLLFGLKDKFGHGSILIQMVPFVLLHFGKAELETLSTILTGLLFGYIAFRGNSFWPALIIHIVINVAFVVFVNVF